MSTELKQTHQLDYLTKVSWDKSTTILQYRDVQKLDRTMTERINKPTDAFQEAFQGLIDVARQVAGVKWGNDVRVEVRHLIVKNHKDAEFDTQISVTCFPPDGGSYTFTTPTRSRKQLGPAKSKIVDAALHEAVLFWGGQRGTANMFDKSDENGKSNKPVEVPKASRRGARKKKVDQLPAPAPSDA